MQLAWSCLLDLFAQGLRRSALTDPWRICSRLTPRLAQKSASQPLSSQLHGYGLEPVSPIRLYDASVDDSMAWGRGGRGNGVLLMLLAELLQPDGRWWHCKVAT